MGSCAIITKLWCPVTTELSDISHVLIKQKLYNFIDLGGITRLRLNVLLGLISWRLLGDN